MPQGKTRADMVAEALKLVMAQGEQPPVETASAAPMPKPAPQVLTPELLAALVRLHGSGAKLSSVPPNFIGTTDERALAMRPRSMNHGKDILLPKGGR
jgi:hypothetical protein